MSDELTNALAESGKLHGLAADTSGKLHSWSDALERIKRYMEQNFEMTDLVVQNHWMTIDHIVCAMRDQEGEIDRALRIPTIAAGELVEQTLGEFADEWHEGEVILANPYPISDSAQDLIPLPAPQFYPSDGARYASTPDTVQVVPENVNSIGEPITEFLGPTQQFVCLYCGAKLFGDESNIDSTIRKHFDYCDQKPDEE